jgi:hypothetical protein
MAESVCLRSVLRQFLTKWVTNYMPFFTLTEWCHLPTLYCLQVSAAGVWDTSVALACRANDVVSALPTAQLLIEVNKERMLTLASVRPLAVIGAAVQALKAPNCTSPFMSRPQLQGWLLVTPIAQLRLHVACL